MSDRTHVAGGLMVLAAITMAVLFTGCGSSYGPTLPSPDEADGPVGRLCGTVTDSEGAPIANAYVYVGLREDPLERIETDAQGRFCLPDLAPGTYAMTTAAAGYATQYQVLSVTGETQTVDVVMDETVETNPTDCPVITVEAGEVSETAGTVQISGTVTNTDADVVVLFQDGEPTLTGLTEIAVSAVSVEARAFNQLVFLHPGTNIFRVLASNATCTVISDPVNVQWTPPAGSDFFFRVTLTWDTPTSDPDLHTWSPEPDNQHSAFWNKTINAGQLDVDDTEGFGPENFTCKTLVPGRFRIAVNSYSLDRDNHASCTVRVVTGGLASNSVVRTFGPYRFTAANNEGGYPVTGNTDYWWRPTDILVSEEGEVTLVAADNFSLVRHPSGTPAQASGTASAK
ncbi:MAG: carboxypeptidase regulatory-like domain-containing protein [Armatimonadota bacterium]